MSGIASPAGQGGPGLRLGWAGRGSSPPRLSGHPRPPAPAPSGGTQGLLDGGPEPAVDAAGGVLGQARDAFPPGDGGLCTTQPFTGLDAHPHGRQVVMGVMEEASAS